MNGEGDYKEIARVPLKENFGSSTYVIAAALTKTHGTWSYEKIGESGVGNLNSILARFV